MIKVTWELGLKLSDVKAGDVLICDGGFTCIGEGAVVEVVVAERGGSQDRYLAFPCRSIRHALDGQKKADGTLSGLMRAPAAIAQMTPLPTKVAIVAPPAPAPEPVPEAAAPPSQLATTITQIVGDILSRDDVTIDDKLVEQLGADSLDMVEIVMAIEEEIGQEIQDDQIKQEEGWRVSDLVQAVEKLIT